MPRADGRATAERLFAERGVEAVSLREVAGFTEDLLEAAAGLMLAPCRARCGTVVSPCHNSSLLSRFGLCRRPE